METRANYAIVGMFTVLVILSAFGFVYWMASIGGGGETATLIVRIPGSANGLSVGSAVRFNGIAIGTVRQLAIDRDSPNFVLARTEVQADAPIVADTKAALEIQGLTGSAYIELQGGTPGKPSIVREALENDTAAVLQADPSNITNLLATADQILSRANRVVEEIEGFVGDARGPLTQTLRNAEKFSDALGKNAEGIDEFLTSVSSLSKTLKTVSGRLDTTMASVEKLVNAVPADKITTIVENVDKVTGDVAAASGDLKSTIDDFGAAAASFKDLGERAGSSFDKIDKLVTAVDVEKIGKTVDDISVASADARKTLSEARSVAETFSARNADFDQIVADVKQMANRLNAASTRVDGVLAKLDGLLGEGDSAGLMAEARETLKSFKQMAENLNRRIAPIADNLQRFSGTGLSDVEALVQEARRSIQRIEQSISSIERDPQRLIFGGEQVKQYNGRNRR